MDTIASPPPAAPIATRPHRSLGARALALVTSPRSVFEEFLDKPSWFWAAVLVSVAAMIIGFILWNSVIAPYALEQAQSRGAPPERIEIMEKFYSNPGARIGGSVAAGAFNFVFVVLIGLGLFALTSFLMGGKATVKQALAVASHAMLVHIPKAIVVVPLAIARGDPSVSIGPGALMPIAEATGFGPKALAMFLSYFDLFNLWSLALCILGMSVVSRLPTKQVAGAIIAAFLGCAILFSLLGAVFQRG
ncbi:MAG TPA: YIP1 family protein [Candidatus Eisenbacteria bacterium]|jgi:hypothetical protein|nr:YIP1 family protein [Candidatus Eisenbacteria bacterium]